MTSKLENPFGIFYPVHSRDGMQFAVNQCVKEIQHGRGMNGNPWRGDLVIVKYADLYVTMTSHPASFASADPNLFADFH
jgi:hypothetical protein